MAEFKYYTRGGSSPQGKPRVYFTAHADDYGSRFEDIREDILKRQNCAVFYLEPDVEPSEVEDYELRLSQMQLFVVPVTTKLLTAPNRAMDVEVPFALAHHIPVLPLMQESGLDELFKKRFGDLQYLDKHNTDPTAIPYDEKLTKYLNAVIVGDELAAKVRAAFDAYIFLSYRKKDRRCAQELMRLIHSNPLCRDIAIWYDEFLTPGEDFNDAIRAALEKSEMFALAVTPNLINEINYILTTEYPAARELNKDILPAEMEPTDRERLSEMYDGIPEPVEACNSDALRERLLSLIQRLALTEIDSDPQHNFFIGLAYLSGIDVEVDHERAVELITGSAEAGCAEAVEKLISMYENGEGVQRDYRKSVTWRERLIDVRRREYEEAPDEYKALFLFNSIYDCGQAYYRMRMLTEAEKKFIEGLRCAVEIQHPYSKYIAGHSVLACYSMLGDIARANGDMKKAEEYYRKSFEMCEALERLAGTEVIRRDLSVCCARLGDIAMAKGDMKKAEEYYRKGLEIREDSARETGTVKARRDLAVSYDKLGDFTMSNGDPGKAEEYYLKALEICEALEKENGTLQARRDLAMIFQKLGDVSKANGDPRKAEEYHLKSLEMREALFRETGTAIARSDLSVSYSRLGEIALGNGDPVKAEEYFRKGLEISEALARELGTADVRRNLSISYEKLGDVAWENGDMDRAAEYCSKSLEIREELARVTGTVQARRDLSLNYIKLGCIVSAKGDLKKAEEYALKGRDICEDLVRETGTVQPRRDLSMSCIMLADIAKENGDLKKAEEYCRNALKIAEDLARETGTVQSYDDLAYIYHEMGDATGDREYYLKAQMIWRRLSAKYPGVASFRERYDKASKALGQ